jgi:dipeptidyl aminopeptidase/acylaminoacyl peptidase
MRGTFRSLMASASAVAVLAATSAGLLAQSQPAHFPTNEDLRHTRAINDPQLSPDGKLALINVSESTADGGAAHLWLVDLAANTSRQITYSPPDKKDDHGESHGRWSSDGSAIFFLAKRGEKTQLFRLPMSGGEAKPYDVKIAPVVAEDVSPNSKASEDKGAKKDAKPEPVELDVEDFALSASGHWLALIAKDPESAAEEKKTKDKDDAEFVDHEHHLTHLYLLALNADGAANGQPVAAVATPEVQGIAWAPHAEKLAVISEEPNDVGDLRPARSAVILDRSGDSWKTTSLTKIPATVEEQVVWTKDETGLVIVAQNEQDAPPGVGDVYLADTQTGATRLLSHNFSGAIRQVVATGDTSALVAVTQSFTATTAQFPLAGGGGATVLTFGQPAISNVSTNAEQTGWLYEQSGSGAPPELCYAKTLAAGCTRLNTPVMIPSDWRAVAAQPFQWKNGGLTIEGILYLPPDAATKKVPLIVDVHGGPTGQYVNAYSAFAQFLVGQGWALLETNPRGSTGYGASFAAANKNDLGGGDYQDIMTGVDAVIAKFPIDTSRMALMGYSYGGEMAGFVEGKTDRFKAIISGAPVIDQMSEYGTEGSSYYDRWWYGYPWEHEEDAWRQSPLSGVAHAKTPFLLLQGKADTTDPAGQSEEMYRALRQAGVTVELVEYPRENHGPLARGMYGAPSREPWHGFDARKRVVEFIQKQFAAADKK